MAPDELVRLFDEYSRPEALDGLRAELAPGDVPTWAGFAGGVADAVRRA
jgi:hypothetical protein